MKVKQDLSAISSLASGHFNRSLFQFQSSLRSTLKSTAVIDAARIRQAARILGYGLARGFQNLDSGIEHFEWSSKRKGVEQQRELRGMKKLKSKSERTGFKLRLSVNDLHAVSISPR
jgi:hypothetical protein